MKKKNAYVLFFICVVLSFYCLSCRQKSQSASFIGMLDLADSLVSENQFKDAWTILEGLEKAAIRPDERLAVIKRYMKTGRDERAELLLKKAIADYKTNLELNAVYTHFLLNHGRYAEAAAAGSCLAGTKYAPILAEASIKAASDRSVFFDPSFIPHYQAAAGITHDTSFLRNAALIYAKSGDYAAAALLHPQTVHYYEQPFFWALISYDSGFYEQSLADLALLDNTKDVLALRSDIYLKSGLLDRAAEIWKDITTRFPDFSPVPYYNAAYFSRQNGGGDSADFLFSLVNRFPNYVPGVLQYGKLALESLRFREDDLAQAVRRADMRSLQMMHYDSLPKIPVSDALVRMEKTLAATGDEQLSVELMKLRWQLDGKTVPEKTVDLWLALEAHPDNWYLRQYAVWFFLYCDKIQEARHIFEKYLLERYGQTDGRSLDGLSVAETEYAAYLWAVSVPSAPYDTYDPAIEMYKKVLALEPENAPAHINLACLYTANGLSSAALEQYAAASRLPIRDEYKSEIHYRSARLYFARKDTKNALISVQYALSLNPENTKARLLHRQLQAQ